MRKSIATFALAALTAASGFAAVAVLPEQAAFAGTFTYTVTNYDNDGTHGVILRSAPSLGAKTSKELYYGVHVDLLCGTTGDAVGPHNNTAWDQVRVDDGSYAGSTGYLSEHWLNTPVGANQHVSGEPTCGSGGGSGGGSTSSAAQKAISWATGQLGSTSWNNKCLSFVRNAYAAAGVNLYSEVSVAWGSNTYPQDIWGHFTHGSTGTGTPPAGALVFYLAKSGRSKTYSHVTIATDSSGNTISSTDTVNHSVVHRESISQHSSSGAYNYYVGWWLP